MSLHRHDKPRGRIATRYHRPRRDELRAAVVGEPRHELDHAPAGDGGYACGDYRHFAVRAIEFLNEVIPGRARSGRTRNLEIPGSCFACPGMTPWPLTTSAAPRD